MGKFDIDLQYKLKPINIAIEIKTKKEKPTKYIEKHDKRLRVDITASVPTNKIGQVLSADYTIWAMSSPFSIFSNYADSSTEIIGITRKEDINIHSFEYMPATDKTTEYYVIKLDEKRSQLAYTGMNALQEVIKEIKERYEAPE